MNCLVDSEGAHPIQIQSELSPQMKGLLQVVKAFEEITVETAINGDYELAIQALTIHPLVGDIEAAKKS